MGNPVDKITSLLVDAQYDPTVEVWEREIIRDFGSRLQVALADVERSYEEQKDENPTVREYFVGAFSRLQGIPSAIPRAFVCDLDSRDGNPRRVY